MRLKIGLNDEIEIFVDRLSIGGRGVGRHEGMVVFVSNAAPQERLRVRLTLVKKNFAEAEIVSILEPSPHRVTPPCPVAGVCGGCTWQQVAYPEQLSQKRDLVRETLRKFSGFDVSNESLVQPTVASPNEFRYRNRVQFHFKKGRLGFFKKGSHDLVDITDCPITDERITEKIPSLKAALDRKASGRFEMLVTREGKVKRRGDATNLDDDPGGLAFSQVNSSQNELLVQSVVSEILERVGADFSGTIYDLYCGDGNFTFPLAKAFPKASFEGVELNRSSIEKARARTTELGLDSRMNWFATDVAAHLSGTPLDKTSFILLDPPRVGCSPEVVSAIVNSDVDHVVYVSCHPVTLGRDLKAFKDAGFTLDDVRPFDMFPQTDHVETVAYLSRA